MDHVGNSANFVDGVNHVYGFGGIGHANTDDFAFFSANGF